MIFWLKIRKQHSLFILVIGSIFFFYHCASPYCEVRITSASIQKTAEHSTVTFTAANTGDTDIHSIEADVSIYSERIYTFSFRSVNADLGAHTEKTYQITTPHITEKHDIRQLSFSSIVIDSDETETKLLLEEVFTFMVNSPSFLIKHNDIQITNIFMSPVDTNIYKFQFTCINKQTIHIFDSLSFTIDFMQANNRILKRYKFSSTENILPDSSNNFTLIIKDDYLSIKRVKKIQFSNIKISISANASVYTFKEPISIPYSLPSNNVETSSSQPSQSTPTAENPPTHTPPAATPDSTTSPPPPPPTPPPNQPQNPSPTTPTVNPTATPSATSPTEEEESYNISITTVILNQTSNDYGIEIEATFYGISKEKRFKQLIGAVEIFNENTPVSTTIICL